MILEKELWWFVLYISPPVYMYPIYILLVYVLLMSLSLTTADYQTPI